MTTASDCQRWFCAACYTAAIARLCATLRPDMALYVRRAAAVHLGTHGTGDTGGHPGHIRDQR